MILPYYILSFSLSLILVYFSKKIAIKFNIVDNPGGRKMHKNPKPLLGGLAVYLSIFLTYALYTKFIFDNKMIIALFLGFILVLVGLYDDYKDMRAINKLIIQMLIALATTLIDGDGGIKKIEIYGHFLEFSNWQGIILQTIWIVGLINAFNLIDGLDGLSSGMGIISLASLMTISLINKDATYLVLIIIIIAALFGFLYYNFYPSSIFLGDSGAMFIGYMIAILSINTNKTLTLSSIVLLILIVFLPFMDILLAILRRKKNKQKAFEADALHFHHRLLLKGYAHYQVVLILYGMMIFYGLGAISMQLSISNKYKLIIVLFLLILTLFIFERLYLLSDRYAYIHKFLRYIKYDILKIKPKKNKRRIHIHKK